MCSTRIFENCLVSNLATDFWLISSRYTYGGDVFMVCKVKVWLDDSI